MKPVNRMMRFAILFAVVGALVGCSDSGGGGGGGADTVTITIDGTTTTFTESGTDPDIFADGDVAGGTGVGLSNAGDTHALSITWSDNTVGSFPVGAVPPSVIILYSDPSTLLGYFGLSGTLSITAYGGVGGLIVGEIPDLIFTILGDPTAHPASLSFSITRDT